MNTRDLMPRQSAGATANDSVPVITAVIPTYRRPRLLRRAIRSVLSQGDMSLRVCVYDNASGDETADVVAALASDDPRVRYHCHTQNLGPAANFDYALHHIETPFFSILSDDDYLLPGFYQHALRGLRAHPQAMFWVGMTLNVDSAGVIWDARVARWPREGLFTPPSGFSAMTGRAFQPAWTGMVFKREVLEQAGYPDCEMLGPADLEFCLRLAARFAYVVEKWPAAVFTLSDASFSATQPLSSFWPGWQRMMQTFATASDLSSTFRYAALKSLRRDAEHMLWRRGANALAARRLEFAREAADALDRDCGRHMRARLLHVLAWVCQRSATVQRGYTASYRSVERRIVQSRTALQHEYGDLLRTP